MYDEHRHLVVGNVIDRDYRKEIVGLISFVAVCRTLPFAAHACGAPGSVWQMRHIVFIYHSLGRLDWLRQGLRRLRFLSAFLGYVGLW